jgi:hypothetical protein
MYLNKAIVYKKRAARESKPSQVTACVPDLGGGSRNEEAN